MAKEAKLIIGDSPVGMPPPNHLVPTDDIGDAEVGLYLRWPLSLLMSDDAQGIFVDSERHQVDDKYEWQDHPPTWMDPHVFADMVMADERVQKIYRVAVKKNDPEAWKRTLKLIDRIFDEQYLPYIMDKFEDAKPLLAQWMLRCHADRALAEKERKPRKKGRRKQ